MKVAAIDIGIHNCAIAIEEFNEKVVFNTKDDVYMEGKLIFLEKIDFAPNVKGVKITNSVLNNITNYFESHIDLIKDCDFLFIEKQYKSFGAQNSTCIHIEHHIQGILLYFLKNTKVKVQLYSAKLKTKIFDTTHMTKIERKKFTTKEAIDLLLAREDYENLKLLNGSKKDDYADVIMMIQSYKARTYCKTI